MSVEDDEITQAGRKVTENRSATIMNTADTKNACLKYNITKGGKLSLRLAKNVELFNLCNRMFHSRTNHLWYETRKFRVSVQYSKTEFLDVFPKG